MLTSIVAIDLRGAIGCQNELPWRLKSDLAFFREKTLDNCVLMGRKTFESLGSKCLPRRNNVVLSHNNVLFPSTEKCKLALSVDEALFVADQYDDAETFVIGGALTYQQFDELVDRYILTVVDHQVPNADAFLSQNVLNSLQDWDREQIASYPKVDGQDDFAFSVFEIVAPDAIERAAARRRRIERFRSKLPNAKPAGRRTAKSSTFSQNAFAF